MPPAPPPITPPQGRAAVVTGREGDGGQGDGGEGGGSLASQVEALGFAVDAFADPYTAFAAVCRRPLVYRAVVLSLGGLYREELSVVAATRGHFAHVEVWLARTDGRPAALAEGLALGASALLGDDGLHRLAPAPPPPPTRDPTPVAPEADRRPPAKQGRPGGSAVNGTGRRATPQPQPVAVPHRRPAPPPTPRPEPVPLPSGDDDALLTAAELRALLGDDSNGPTDD